MIIPEQFQLLGRTITVEYDNKLSFEHDWCGAACYNEDKIKILPASEMYPVTRGKIEATFCHELAHFLLYYSGDAINGKLEGYIHKDENFVELLGNILHQFFNTSRGCLDD